MFDKAEKKIKKLGYLCPDNLTDENLLLVQITELNVNMKRFADRFEKVLDRYDEFGNKVSSLDLTMKFSPYDKYCNPFHTNRNCDKDLKLGIFSKSLTLPKGLSNRMLIYMPNESSRDLKK